MKPISMREADFKKEVDSYSFPKEIKDEFFDYWTEPNPSNTKMRFELEKTWHMGRRIARWARNSKVEIRNTKPMTKEVKIPNTEAEKLDAFIEFYKTNSLKVKFEDFGSWYDWMKREKLLRELTQADIDTYLNIYNGDKMKCRCAVVMDTLSGYVNSGLRIVDILDLRKRINGSKIN